MEVFKASRILAFFRIFKPWRLGKTLRELLIPEQILLYESGSSANDLGVRCRWWQTSALEASPTRLPAASVSAPYPILGPQKQNRAMGCQRMRSRDKAEAVRI